MERYSIAVFGTNSDVQIEVRGPGLPPFPQLKITHGLSA